MNDQVTPAETAEILRLAEQCLDTPGDFVELGCYRGDTSVLLGKLLQASSSILPKNVQNHPSHPLKNVQQTLDCPLKNAPKRLWLYDSFAGLPTKTPEDASGAGANFQAGELFVSKRDVIDKIRKNGLHNVIIKKAWFDELTPEELPSQIAFAFLDGDLYSSIKTSLHLVTPLLAEQGIMVVHDYNNPELPGSARAVDEWLRAHPDYYLQVRHTIAILRKDATIKP